MGKIIKFDIEARNSLKKGIDTLANAVKVTMGPKGKNVVIQKQYGLPHITKDGVTVAKSIDLDDPIENIGAQLVKEVASQVNYLAGDGTTTATVLAQAIYNEGHKMLSNGIHASVIKAGVDKAVEIVVDILKEQAKPVEKDQIEQIASISANNNKEIGSLIAQAMEIAGENGIITIEKSKTTKTYVETSEGTEFDNGYMSPYFSTDTEKLITEYNNCYILVCESKITTVKELLPILEEVMDTGKPLLIIAEDLSADVLNMLVRNKMQAGLQVVAVKPPGFGDRRKAILEDLAIATGGTIISETTGLKLEKVSDLTLLGSCEKVIVTKDVTTIVGGKGNKEDINNRVEQVKAQLTQTDFDYDVEKLQERLAKLVGKIAVLHVGAGSEVELNEKKDRVDDALAATRAAVEEGIIPSGANVLAKISNMITIEDPTHHEAPGMIIIKKALTAPIKQICINGEVSTDLVINDIFASKQGFGYNAKHNEIQNLVMEGIIDPVKVSRVAIEKAASIASTLLSTECIIVEEKKE